jgi:peptidoglycan hydrolase-like protein with peptidoglycan-binding domain
VPRKKKSLPPVERGAVAAAIVGHPREFVGIVLATAATAMIFANALFLQRGPHPAPIFATRPQAVAHKPQAVPRATVAPAAPAAVPQAAPDAAANRIQTVSDIQRELGNRGFYDGPVDGIWGAKTDAAVREFLQAAGLRINPDAGDALLRAIASSPVRRSAPPQVTRNDAIAQLLAPSKRVVAIQSALSDFGYGQLKPTGVYDAETRAAIEKFERDRRMPVTGQMSERCVRELAAMSGRPLE